MVDNQQKARVSLWHSRTQQGGFDRTHPRTTHVKLLLGREQQTGCTVELSWRRTPGTTAAFCVVDPEIHYTYTEWEAAQPRVRDCIAPSRERAVTRWTPVEQQAEQHTAQPQVAKHNASTRGPVEQNLRSALSRLDRQLVFNQGAVVQSLHQAGHQIVRGLGLQAVLRPGRY
jgi:hypothetical protein